MKTKITLGLLDKLASEMQEISKTEMSALIGGGDGTIESPYTLGEMDMLLDTDQWTGGYVDYLGYVTPSAFVYGSQYNGYVSHYNCSVADFALGLVNSGLEQSAGVILSSLPVVSYPLSYIMQEMNDCKAQMLHDVIESGQGNDNIDFVVSQSANSSSTSSVIHIWRAYDAKTGKTLATYEFNMMTGCYSKVEE